MTAPLTGLQPGTTYYDEVVATSAGGTDGTILSFTTVQEAQAPTIAGLSPTSGPAAGGTSVTITGTGFTGATVVDFGTTAATDLAVVNNITITADSPAGTGTVNVTVTTPAARRPPRPPISSPTLS
jgi:hypothetical protein